jgi:hypothetical protein
MSKPHGRQQFRLRVLGDMRQCLVSFKKGGHLENQLLKIRLSTKQEDVYLPPADEANVQGIEYVMGRSGASDIDIGTSMLLSRHHAMIKPVSQSSVHWKIIDLSSRNGIYINFNLVEGSRVLAHGDIISFTRQVAYPDDYDPRDETSMLFVYECVKKVPSGEKCWASGGKRRKYQEDQEMVQVDALCSDRSASLISSEEGLQDGDCNRDKSSAFAAVREELTCCICYELFMEPVTLECSHTFCSECIEGCLSRKMACPVCRHDTINDPIPNQCITKLVASVATDDEVKRMNDHRYLMVIKRSIQKRNWTQIQAKMDKAISNNMELLNVFQRWSQRERSKFWHGVCSLQDRYRVMYCSMVGLSKEAIFYTADKCMIVCAAHNLSVDTHRSTDDIRKELWQIVRYKKGGRSPRC